MKDYQSIYENCKAKLIACGYQPGNITKVCVNKRFSRAMGRTRKRGDTYIIELSLTTVDDNTPLRFTETVMLHELIHTCNGCFNHGKPFNEACQKVNKTYGYNVGITIDCRNEGVNNIVNAQTAKYKVVCDYCGNYQLMKRMCKIVKDAPRSHNYRCGRCNHRSFHVEILH